MASLKSIKLRIANKLRDESYRRAFFKGLTQDEIAEQIRDLRKKRGLRQADLARLTGTTQSGISRLEQAEYSRWSFSTLMSIADALDARVRFIMEPAEDVIRHYQQLEEGAPQLVQMHGTPKEATSVPFTRSRNPIVELFRL